MNNFQKEFGKIYDQHVEKIYRFICLKMNSKEEAEDLTSEAFLRCWQVYKNDQKVIKNVQAFLYQIARNLVTDYYRINSRTKIISADIFPIIDPHNNIKEMTEQKADLEKIKTVLSDLDNQDYQDIIIWHYIEDLSVPEIADITGKPQGTIRVMLHRALNEVKKRIINEI